MNLLFQDFIDTEKWNAAQWFATAFLHDQDGFRPPYLGVVFENIAVGREIFTGWLNRLGAADQYEELRISVIEGRIAGESNGYSVHISSDPLHTEERAKASGVEWNIKRYLVTGRVNRMTPQPGSAHLARFQQQYRKHKSYYVIPVSAQIEPCFEYAIQKKEIFFRHSAAIREDDQDAVVFPEGHFKRRRGHSA